MKRQGERPEPREDTEALYWGGGLGDKPDYGKSHTQAHRWGRRRPPGRGRASPVVETPTGTRHAQEA